VSAAFISQGNLVLFVVDTEQYAGDFERQLVAWMTGQVGECKVGQEEAETARQALPADAWHWFERHIVAEPDDRG